MKQEICFICGAKIGRGNRSEVGSQEKMEKLVSVSNTVEHSSTIISDILSRILNETVMHEENVCRICFNFLNDIDYHLKEAQEKTDEITAKFLDKEKDPLQYEPSNLLDPRSADHHTGSNKKRRMFGKLVTTSGSRPGAHTKSYEESSDVDDNVDYLNLRHEEKSIPRFNRRDQTSPKHKVATKSIKLVPVTSAGPGRSKNNHLASSPRSSRLRPPEHEVDASSADEMTVNALAEKKRRLISRVLAPNKRPKQELVDESDGDGEKDGYYVEEVNAYDELTIDDEDGTYGSKDAERLKRKKEKKRKKKERERERRMKVLQLEKEKREREETRRADIVLRLSEDESEEEEEAKENTSPKKTKEIRTVDLAQLGDLFSNSPDKEEKPPPIQVLARKTVPTPAARKQMDFNSGQTFFILPHTYSSEVPAGAEQLAPVEAQQIGVGQVIAEADHNNQIIMKQDISLNVRDVSEVDFNQQYTPIKTSTVMTDTQPPVYRPTQPATASAIVRYQEHQDTTTSYRAGNKPGGTPSIPCPHCDKKFMRGYNMRVHIDRVHNKKKPWQCQFCEKAFATTSDLKQHMSSHGMGKIHKCADCGRQFNNRDSAILHRKQHNNERTHVCPECNKGFFKSSCLTRHRRCHTGEKPFQCDFCYRKFSQVTTLKHHRKVCKEGPAEGPSSDKNCYPEQKVDVNPHRKINITF